MAKSKKRGRRTFTEEFKKNVVAEIESGMKVVDAAKTHNIQAAQLSQWRKKYGTGKKSKAKARKRGIATRQSRVAGVSNAVSASTPSVADLERVIGRLTIENMALRQELDQLRSK